MFLFGIVRFFRFSKIFMLNYNIIIGFLNDYFSFFYNSCEFFLLYTLKYSDTFS